MTVKIRLFLRQFIFLFYIYVFFSVKAEFNSTEQSALHTNSNSKTGKAIF